MCRVLEKSELPQTGEEETVATVRWGFLKDNLICFVGGGAIVLLLLILAYIKLKDKYEDEEKQKKVRILLIGAMGLLVLILGVIVIYVSFFSTGSEGTSGVIEDEASSEEGRKDGEDQEVLGIEQTQMPSESVGASPVYVTQPVGYIIYSRPDKESKVVYEAKEGEKFTVVKEEGDWYLVQLPDGNSGWLQKSMVQMIEKELVSD